ncbi:MAG: phenylalanine--tRNA ligase subunit beta [Fuerstiella sp.]|nr:phenylalanine--tRNA ligase subunit beta [Fuerstiella sp.]
MIVSHNWLAEYVALPDSVDDLTDRLTMSGLNLEGLQPVGDDLAIDLEVTSNRPDCLGHIGVAREVAALFNRSLSIPVADVQDSNDACSNAASVRVDCPDLCHEYHARVIQGVRIGPSPDWLRDRLASVGISSVNNVVDVTNYVMLECGQPLHAFDFDKVNGSSIIVRQAVTDEKITAIDQREYMLPADACVIADQAGPVAVAGVMGGLETEISDSTTNVLIEVASFDPVSVRSTARALKLHSPSSYRFERRVNRRNMDWASRRCCELILQTAGGRLLAGSVVAGDRHLEPPAPVTLRFDQITRLLGMEIPADDCVSILSRLGLECTSQSGTEASFIIPDWRLDITRECDLIEEVARIHGYDRIPDDAMLPVAATSRSRREVTGDRIRSHLTACGFFEALTLSFVSESMQQLFRPRGDLSVVAVDHSTRSLENQLRQSLIPSLLQCRRQNERTGTANAELFEVARVYLSAGDGKPEREAEPMTVGMVSGHDFLGLKGIVETLVLDLIPAGLLATQPMDIAGLADGRGAQLVLNGQRLGYIGELDRSAGDQLGLHSGVSVAELDAMLLEELYESRRRSTPPPRFPAISRDLNFVLAETVDWAELADVAQAAGGTLLASLSFGGQYRGSQIDAGCKSYVLSARFQAPDRTLTADEVDAAVGNIVTACQEKLEAQLR